MTGYEVCKILDINKSTLRFYRDKGLVSPRRRENGYFDYSLEDFSRLFQIKKFRILSSISIENLHQMFFDDMRFLENANKELQAEVEDIDRQINELQRQKQKLMRHININNVTSKSLGTIQLIESCTSFNYVKYSEVDSNLELVNYICNTGLGCQSLVFPKEKLFRDEYIVPEYAIGINDMENRGINLDYTVPHTVKAGQKSIRLVTKITSPERIPSSVFDNVKKYIYDNSITLSGDITSTVLTVNNSGEYIVIFKFIIE